MKIYKRIAGLFVAILMLTALLPVSAMAAGLIDTERSVSLTITNLYDGKTLETAFKIYQVSAVDACGELTVLPAFSAYAGDLDIRGEDDDAWRAVTQKLEDAVLAGKVNAQPITASTDDSGAAAFTGLDQGLYLVLGTRTVVENYVYSTVPFMVLLPQRDAERNVWDYDVVVSAKPGVTPVRMDYTVVKSRQDKGYESKRPASIEITLWCDGQPYAAVTLPQDGKWYYTWENLEVTHTWEVREIRASGYLEPTVTVSEDGHIFTVTNTYDAPKTPEPPKLPQTGQLWWPVPLLIAAGMLFVVIGLIRRRGDADEK